MAQYLYASSQPRNHIGQLRIKVTIKSTASPIRNSFIESKLHLGHAPRIVYLNRVVQYLIENLIKSLLDDLIHVRDFLDWVTQLKLESTLHAIDFCPVFIGWNPILKTPALWWKIDRSPYIKRLSVIGVLASRKTRPAYKRHVG